MKLEFPWQIFEKKAQISSFNKIHSVGADFFLADRRTDRQDMTKLIAAFRNCAKAPKSFADAFSPNFP
jgi:hypothetical protein